MSFWNFKFVKDTFEVIDAPQLGALPLLVGSFALNGGMDNLLNQGYIEFSLKRW